jgi:hypothetical protein
LDGWTWTLDRHAENKHGPIGYAFDVLRELQPLSANPKSPIGGESQTVAGFHTLADKSAKELESYHVILETSWSQIELGFLPEIAPEHVRNFSDSSQLGFYDHTAWHPGNPREFHSGGRPRNP